MPVDQAAQDAAEKKLQDDKEKKQKELKETGKGIDDVLDSQNKDAVDSFKTNFGVGISMFWPEHDIIESAQVVGGVVRVDEVMDFDVSFSLMAQHYFLVFNDEDVKRQQLKALGSEAEKAYNFFAESDVNDDYKKLAEKGNWLTSRMLGLGGFLSLGLGDSDDIIEHISVGLLVGVRRPNSAAEKLTGEFENISIGVGWGWRPNAQFLGNGIVEGQPLPAGEESVRYKKQSVGGLVVMISGSF